MSTARFVKIVLRDGKNIAINMRNVLSVKQHGLHVIVNYNATHSDSSGFLIFGNGFYLGGGTTIKEEFIYTCEKDAQYAYEKLTNELK